MQWPKDIVDAFKEIPFVPSEQETVDSVVQHILDQSARFAVWRLLHEGHPNLDSAYHSAFTPLGYLTTTGFDGKIKHLTLGSQWMSALDALGDHIRGNSQAIVDAFKCEAMPYGRRLVEAEVVEAVPLLVESSN